MENKKETDARSNSVESASDSGPHLEHGIIKVRKHPKWFMMPKVVHDAVFFMHTRANSISRHLHN